MSTLYDYDWSPAQSLLNPHDRFTRAEIKRDFQALHPQCSVQLDGELWATPVADNRYTVIWQLPEPGHIEIKAVVASQYRGEQPEALRRKLQRVVEAESHGLISLD